MTHNLRQVPDLAPMGASATDIEDPRNSGGLVKAAAQLLDPSIMPRTSAKLAKISLTDMAYWLMELRLKLRFRSGINEGTDADFAVIELTAKDAAMLERIADSLNYLARERQRAAATMTQTQNNGVSRR